MEYTEKSAVLRDAMSIIEGDRHEQHGEYYECFDAIASLWHSYLLSTTSKRSELLVDRGDVARMMILLKLARDVTGSGGVDNKIDIAGYASLLGAMENEPPRTNNQSDN